MYWIHSHKGEHVLIYIGARIVFAHLVVAQRDCNLIIHLGLSLYHFFFIFSIPLKEKCLVFVKYLYYIPISKTVKSQFENISVYRCWKQKSRSKGLILEIATVYIGFFDHRIQICWTAVFHFANGFYNFRRKAKLCIKFHLKYSERIFREKIPFHE